MRSRGTSRGEGAVASGGGPTIDRIGAGASPTTGLRPVDLGLIVAGLIVAAYVWRSVVIAIPNGGDSWAYWTASYADPYSGARHDAVLSYLYSPAFLQAILPLKALPWDVFRGVWVALLIGSVLLMAPRAAVVLLLLPPVLFDLEVGNIHLLLAFVCVAGFRYPALWSFAILTKVTPAIGLLWFAVRREWRSLAIAMGATAAIVLVSFAVAPQLWLDWFVVFGRPSVGPGAIPIPLGVRLPAAALVVIWGARTDRRWTVPFAAMLSLPNLWINGLAMVVAVFVLVDWDRASVAVRAASMRLRGGSVATSRLLRRHGRSDGWTERDTESSISE